jgi:hypothetical protein
VATRRKKQQPSFFSLFATLLLVIPFFLVLRHQSFGVQLIFMVIPYLGILGNFLFRSQQPPKRRLKKEKPERDWLFLSSIGFIIFGGVLSIVLQEKWLLLVEKGFWLFSLFGYWKAFQHYYFHYTQKRKIVIQDNLAVEKSIIQPLWLLIITFLQIVLFAFYLWRSRIYYQFGFLFQIEWLGFSLNQTVLFLLCVPTFLFACYSFQVENRSRKHFPAFVISAVVTLLSWINIFLFFSFWWSIGVLVLLLGGLLSSPANERNRGKKEDLFLCLVLIFAFTVVGGLISLIGSERWWSWKNSNPTQWEELKVKLVETSPLKLGKVSNLQLSIKNTGKAKWTKRQHLLQIRVVDNSKKEIRYGKAINLPILEAVKPTQQIQKLVSLPIPYWLKKGGILVEVIRKDLQGKVQFGSVDYVPLNVDLGKRYEHNLSLKYLHEREYLQWKKKQNLQSKKIVKEIQKRPRAIDRILASYALGKYYYLDENLQKNENAYLNFVANYGLITGFGLSLFAIAFWLTYLDAGVGKKGRQQPKELIEIYLTLAFLIIIWRGFWGNLPILPIGQVYVLFCLAQIKQKIMSRKNRSSYSY